MISQAAWQKTDTLANAVIEISHFNLMYKFVQVLSHLATLHLYLGSYTRKRE